MKIKKPNDTILVDNVTQRDLLDVVCSKRSGTLKNFFLQNKVIFLDDNDRFHSEFEASKFYINSQVNYRAVQKSLNNLYRSAADDNERKYIGEMRRQHRQLLCPYCLRSNCRTLDHYFDKISYSELSLNIWNLVPTCGDCNFKKLSTHISSSSQRFIHPYFDDFYDRNESYHLKIIITETENVILVNFDFIANPTLNDQNVQSVINWHIQTLEIATDNADMFRKDFEYYINKIREKGFLNNAEIEDFLNEELSYEREFSWRGVMLHSLCHNQQNFQSFTCLVFCQEYTLNT
ncbi:hypothetical protein [Yersinia intermedia]|uniref:hypothetical protein n=1 Tax=Yersinia intermedia TaxID=631 RepID=UPI0039C7312B